ncbi:MAG: phosphatidate cytidylyltransferase [Alphaproteobacteria bacterium]|nr:phosphatidate cytidylyltransferase [Alphaproteobacteria bacterium]
MPSGNTSSARGVLASQQASGRWGGLGLRVLSSLVLAPLALAAIYLGTPWVDAFMAAAAMLMAWEWSHLCNRGRGTGRAVLMIGVTAAALAASVAHFFAIALAVGVAGTLLVYLYVSWRDSRSDAARDLSAPAWTAAGVAWISVPCAGFLWLRGLPEDGLVTALWLILVVWATDIGAYVAGRSIGGPKLAPSISPGKTWAGLAGGVAAAACVGYGVSQWVGASPVAAIVGKSAVLAVAAQAGDLAESYVKRRFGAKDAGTLIPGHGGMLDRLDGFLAAVAVAALVAVLIGESVFAWH